MIIMSSCINKYNLEHQNIASANFKSMFLETVSKHIAGRLHGLQFIELDYFLMSLIIAIGQHQNKKDFSSSRNSTESVMRISEIAAKSFTISSTTKSNLFLIGTS